MTYKKTASRYLGVCAHAVIPLRGLILLQARVRNSSRVRHFSYFTQGTRIRGRGTGIVDWCEKLLGLKRLEAFVVEKKSGFQFHLNLESK